MLIVDGYNVIGRVPSLRDKKSVSLEAARAALARMVAEWRRGHGGADCLIVFDGRDAGGRGAHAVIGGVRCLFSRTKVEADDEIIRAVRECRGGGAGITVVSDDNYVGNNCRAHGASVRSASFFEEAQNKRAARQSREPGAVEKKLDRKAASDIDEEQRRRFGL